ncbi:uncharacterized protein [Dermacentor andersoni]|uniref:uncharacterized protein n=1 Tax=Dermacentor andersoni TaxID=34620 RepID=UPI003B3A9C78
MANKFHVPFSCVQMPSQTCNLLASALAQCPCRQQVSQDEPEQQQPADLPSALAALEAERQRCRELVRLNAVLQEHLQIATRTNADLASEVHKLTKEWWQLNRSQSADQPQVGVVIPCYTCKVVVHHSHFWDLGFIPRSRASEPIWRFGAFVAISGMLKRCGFQLESSFWLACSNQY